MMKGSGMKERERWSVRNREKVCDCVCVCVCVCVPVCKTQMETDRGVPLG